MAEMRAYLERQIKEREKERVALRAEEKADYNKGYPASLPKGNSIDLEEEAYVKMALKHALDGHLPNKASAPQPRRTSCRTSRRLLAEHGSSPASA